MSIEAMKLALEALELVDGYVMGKHEAMEALRDAIEQAEKQEPVAWFTEDHREDKSATTYSKKMSERWKEKGWPVTPLYTAPPQRSWQGLTDEEIKTAWSQLWYDLNNGKFAASDDPSRHTTVMFARAIEAKLKEKNHD
jgi:hypothetical protein